MAHRDLQASLLVTTPRSWSDLIRAGCRTVVEAPAEVTAVRVSRDFTEGGEGTIQAAVSIATRLAEEYRVHASSERHGTYLTVRLSRDARGLMSPHDADVQPRSRSAGEPTMRSSKEPRMADVLFLALTIVVFATFAGIAEFLWRI